MTGTTRLVALAGLASLGLVTLALSWWAMLWPGSLGPGAAAVCGGVVAAGVAAAWAWAWRGNARGGAVATAGRPNVVLAALVVVTGAGILVNAALWPFAPGDALAVYGPLGREIAAFGALPGGEWQYKAYPQHVPMLYAIIEWVRGAPDEEWSRVVTALYAIGAMAVTWSLAREWRSPRAGWLAAALLASATLFTRWASSGYADIPAGFYLALSTLLAWHWWRRPSVAAAAACGAAAALALWTKQSTVTLLVTAAVVPAGWAALSPPLATTDPARRGFLHLAIACLAAVTLAGPWYVRNQMRFGTALPTPPPYWTDQAQHDPGITLLTLLVYAGMGLLGILLPFVVGLACVRLWVRDVCARAVAVLWLGVVVPFLGSWWWFASYDPRFLVTTLPVVAAYGGVVADEGLARLRRFPLATRRIVAGGALAALAVSWAVALRAAVEHKAQIPFAHLLDDGARHQLRVGSLYDIGRGIDALPSGTVVAGVPDMARYYIHPTRLARVHWAGDRSDAAQRARFTVLAPASTARCAGVVISRTPDGYVVCRRENVP
ncbi:MAG: glycosyltransferase family 39 protein [Vicinamibacteraceae bacterium]|nr:glycosyltransferase family 39 protein [Vicinamibacteraceae bacterium]